MDTISRNLNTSLSIRLLKQAHLQTAKRQVGILTVYTVHRERDIQQQGHGEQPDCVDFYYFASVFILIHYFMTGKNSLKSSIEIIIFEKCPLQYFLHLSVTHPYSRIHKQINSTFSPTRHSGSSQLCEERKAWV